MPNVARIPVLISLLAIQSFGEKAISFDRDIQRILSENCYYCHGTDPKHREGDLRLDLREDALDAGAIVPGKPEKSDLVDRIHSKDPDDLMPPPDSNRKLTEEQKDLLTRWIKEGAEYTKHWAFTKLGKPSGKSIDELVSSHLAEEGLKLKAKAKAHQLLRRLTFDLTGLPPTPEQIEKFDPSQLEPFIDELLASPAYGEHMATPWLDVARYADSYGFQQDKNRRVWPYRDYVINAFNSNKPFDRFIHEQVAGDLLPDATRESRIATTFSRLHQQKVEGGSVPEEFRVEYVADRVHTFGTTFLGLTMECSRCHDHKYDPTTAKDYYSLFAFFDDIDESGLYSFFNPEATPTPAMPLPSEAQEKQLAERKNAVAAALTKVEMVTKEFAPSPADPKDLPNLKPDQLLHLSFDDGKNQGANQSVPGKMGKAIKLTGDDAIGTKVGDFHREQPFTVSLWLQTPDVKDRAVIFSRSKAWHDAASRGYELLLVDNHLQWSLIHFWPGNAISIKTKAPIKPGEWVHVAVSNDGSSSAGGLQIHVNGKPAATEIVRDNLTRAIKGGGNPHIRLGERMRDRGFKEGLIDEFRVFESKLSDQEIDNLSFPVDPAPEPQWTLVRDPSYKEALKELQAARTAYNRLEESIPEIMVMEESPSPKQAYILNRGSYENRGKPVEAAFPEFLPNFGMQASNRLSLAKWLTHPEHPLTSRVIVNRFWQSFFGRGLVGTSEDFGMQGERPEHRELLDELAARFVASGWDTMALVKDIVMSQVYQQDSFADSLQLEKDPENRLLARGPRHRLPAEQIRDQALAASGLLVSKVGGASVHPYDLAESFKPSKPTMGEGLYRRSLYTYWKRTGPSPAMMAFDAVKRDVCSAKRETTSTPLQALVLLNGIQFVETSRHLADQVLQKNPDQSQDAIQEMYLRLASRKADDKEVEILSAIYEEQLTHFKAHPEEANRFLTQGHTKPESTTSELAAMTTVAQAILNLYEVNTKQ
jgi:hypothetical protein